MPTCTCGKFDGRGPQHDHFCPVFIAWSNRNVEVDRLKTAITEAISLLNPGPCKTDDMCQGCKFEWLEALEILEMAMDPTKQSRWRPVNDTM